MNDGISMSSKFMIVADSYRFKLFFTKVDPLERETAERMEGSKSLCPSCS